METVTQEFKDNAMDIMVTLDGHPAAIRGRKLEYAIVGALDTPLSVEFAWATVKRVVDKDGKFRS
jgi:hypothetical protein